MSHIKPTRTYYYEIIDMYNHDRVHDGYYATHYEALLGWFDRSNIPAIHPVTYKRIKRSHVYSMTVHGKPLALIVRRSKNTH